MDAATAQHTGGRLLGEIEEESLHELITAFQSTNAAAHTPAQTSHHALPPTLPFPALAAIVSRYQKATQSAPPPLLSLSGRYLPFLYHLVSTLIAAPHSYAVVLIDADHRFDVTRLISPSSDAVSRAPQAATSSLHPSSPPDPYPATVSDLRHLYVYRPSRSSSPSSAIKDLVASAAEYMLYAPHASRSRHWWGTVVVGGAGGGGDVSASWRGWLECRREEVAGFGIGMSVEEALAERERRQSGVAERGWEAVGAGGRLGVYRWDG